MRWRVLSVLRVLLSTSSEFQGEAKVRVLEQQQQQCIREVLQSMARDARELPDDLMREEAESDGSTGGARRLILVMRVRALQASLELFQRLVNDSACRSYFIESRGVELMITPSLLCPKPTIFLDAPVDVQVKSTRSGSGQ
jgi:hypothetical protein